MAGFISVRKGYEYLADELIDYAVTTMPDWEGAQQLVYEKIGYGKGLHWSFWKKNV